MQNRLHKLLTLPNSLSDEQYFEIQKVGWCKNLMLKTVPMIKGLLIIILWDLYNYTFYSICIKQQWNNSIRILTYLKLCLLFILIYCILYEYILTLYVIFMCPLFYLLKFCKITFCTSDFKGNWLLTLCALTFLRSSLTC